ncbi:MAG: diadenylate cyclase [Armatimonadota bacterium]
MNLRASVVMVIDILLVSYLLYRLILLAKGTRAWQLFYGLFLFLFMVYISGKLELNTLNWVLQQVLPLGPVALVILFYPELRHFLEVIGRLGLWGQQAISPINKEHLHPVVNEIVSAACTMAKDRTGALIIFEPYAELDHYLSPGTPLDAKVTAKLLTALFYTGNPLHDGAVVVVNDRIVCAGATVPFSENQHIDEAVHMRHKAAIGASEHGAVALVVSEESGIISLAFEGKLQRGFRDDALRKRLIELLGPSQNARHLDTLSSSALRQGLLAFFKMFSKNRKARNGKKEER